MAPQHRTTQLSTAQHDGRPGHSRRGTCSTPQGVRREWSPSAASRRAMPQGTAGVALSRHHR
eukprot:4557231-Pyramimonas_sp.AAC.1